MPYSRHAHTMQEAPSCPKCGQPMSFCEAQEPDDTDQYKCDGPNDRTTREGCGEAVAA